MSEARPGWRAAAAIFVFAVVASAVLRSSDLGVYRALFGAVDPALATAGVAVLGAVALGRLQALGWFRAGATSRRSVAVACLLGAALTLPVIIVDTAGGFPAEMNARFPHSLLFYPSIALVAESVFHLLPLAAVATVWRWMARDLSRGRLVAMAVAALIEPAFQVIWGSGQSPLWVSAVVGIQLFVFNVVALTLLRRSGFVALYGFRFGYYLVWHILWGYARLPLLFGIHPPSG